jgi:flagellar basal-body rod protein FlgG
MLRSLQTAATGMDAQQQLIDTLSNNMANVNTTAFKKSRANFNDLLYQNLRAPGLASQQGTIVPSGIQVGNGVRLVSVDKSFQEGAIKVTNNDLDLMVKGRGFFRIQMPDGNIAYTRDGTFKRSVDGRVVTSEGLPLVPEITVPPNTLSLRIGVDGTASATVQGEAEPRALGQIQIASFINPAGLNSMGRNLYTVSPASGEPIVTVPGENGTGLIGQGELESSNVNIVDEMVQMIVGQRAYELNSKVIKTGDEMLATTNQMR